MTLLFNNVEKKRISPIISIAPTNAPASTEKKPDKLNVPADTLKKQLEEGKFDAAFNNMSSSESAKFKQVMNNPKLVEKIISTPQAQALYKKITGEK